MKRCFSIIAPLLLAGSFSFAAQDANPIDVNSVLTTLSTIKKQQIDSSKADKAKLAQIFLNLSNDPTAALNYYEDAIRATKFEGQTRESTQFQEWKRSNMDKMKSAPFREGLRLHLQYLGITMKRSAGVEMKDLVPTLISYTQQVMGAQDSAPTRTVVTNNFNNRSKKPPSAQTLLNPPQAPPALDDYWMGKALSGSIFVNWQQIGSYVSSIEDWEQVPGNVDGIYEKAILPEFRRVKDARVLEYWDMRMQREAYNASKSGRTFDVEKYESSTKPNLLWSRAQELLALDLKNRAVNDMVAVIKSYPTHPNVQGWIGQVEQLLKPPAAQPAAPAAAAATTPAETQPTAPPAAPQG